jgi:hypothetical protein
LVGDNENYLIAKRQRDNDATIRFQYLLKSLGTIRLSSVVFIDALEDTDILQISKANLDKLYERVPKFERIFRLILQNAFIAQQQRINQNLSFTAMSMENITIFALFNS